MVNVCMEIETTRDIARQILRHRSFSFQEFSQRYATAEAFETRECRKQDMVNRQNSLALDIYGNENDRYLATWWDGVQQRLTKEAEFLYEAALNKGIFNTFIIGRVAFFVVKIFQSCHLVMHPHKQPVHCTAWSIGYVERAVVLMLTHHNNTQFI